MLESPESTHNKTQRLPCPRCGRRNTTTIRIIGLEAYEWAYYLRRKRKCLNCGHTFTTVEHTEVGNE